MHALDWRQIRTWKGSQDSAFEELCCQFARTETKSLPPGAHFERRGAPDAGVECLWRMPTGIEWGWQAKFITESPRAKHWNELDHSVRTALQQNPQLQRYSICIPAILPDDRRVGRKSGRQNWNEHVKKWTKWFSDQRRTVEFVLWDESVLLEFLAKPEHTGRRAFWFGGTAFTAEWFSQQGVKPAIRQAAQRYTPPLHIEVPVQQTFQGLIRSGEFHQRLRGEAERIRRIMEETLGFAINLEKDDAQTSLRKSAKQFVESASYFPASASDLLDLSVALSAIGDFEKAIAEEEQRIFRSRSSSSDDRSFIIAQLRDLQRALYQLKEFFSSQEVAASLFGKLVVSGGAGSGKTHLFCATAEELSAKQRPVVLFLGEQFHGNAEPWTQIQQLLGLHMTRDELLGALDTAGQAQDCRTLILIDALNEGAGITYWRNYLASTFEQLRRFPHVSIAVSIRDAYREDIAKMVSTDAAFVSHHGLRGRVAKAARRFFAHYGLPEPNVPVLQPEYENPLFLKLLCETIRSRAEIRLSDPPSFSELLKMVLDDANARVAVSLDYDLSERYVQRAVALVAGMMAKANTDLLPWPLVVDELKKLKPSETKSRSLAQHLISEDLLTRVRGFGADADEEYVRFAYQRFSDFTVVAEMLRDMKTGNVHGKALRRHLREAEWLPASRNWIEAFATLSPEFGGPELPDVATSFDDSPALRSAFLHSIVWRKHANITSNTEKHLQTLLMRSDECREEAYETIIFVATRPEHPLNAEWLDRFLRTLTMAERDGFWSTAIFGGWKKDGAIKRLIEWAWQPNVAIGLPTDVVRIAAIALTWMLTTSDRFVRDRATKALVSLLEDSIPILRQLLDCFADLPEPYLQERLHAAAFGCAMRTHDDEQLLLLAQATYDRVFRNGRPPPSVLLRDHARGVVELARYRKLKIKCNPKLLVPPYKSQVPDEPPSDEQLRHSFHADTFNDGYEGTARIYRSVTGDDFNHYTIKDVAHWCGTIGGVRLGRSPRKLFDALLDKLPADAKEIMHDIERLYNKAGRMTTEDEDYHDVWRAVATVENILPTLLGKPHARLVINKLKPYFLNPHDHEFNNHFSIELFERLILQKILDLGWRNDLLGEFDTTVSSHSRDAHKPERIGKKYQWIAYDELHAKISDNYGLADTSSRVMYTEDWERGLWPTNHRDLDPSLLLRATPRDGWGANHSNWWTPHSYTAWHSKPTVKDWLMSSADVPPIGGYLQLRDGKNDGWLLLDGFHLWRRKVEADSTWKPARDSQELHLIFRSYLTKAADLQSILAWGHGQNWINDRLPSAEHHFHVHLFEHYWSQHFAYPEAEDWITELWHKNDLPAPIVPTTGEYMCEHGTYDCSVDSTVTISMPSRWLAAKLKVKPTGRNADFIGNDNRIIVFDPSTREKGQSVVVCRTDAMNELLESQDLAIFWTLLGEKNYYPPEREKHWPGRLTMLGIYSLHGDEIRGGFRTEFHQGRN
jgi:hypothetical protein